jgi:IclR family mhp operon transcriptional activator
MSGAYKDVKSLDRGLRILEVLGRRGRMKIGALAAAAGIERSSTYRLVNTLVELGYLVRRDEDGAISLTAKVRHIADGFRDDDLMAQTVTPFIHNLTRVVLWPSDFATFTGGAVTTLASSHKLSPMSVHRVGAVIGIHRSLFLSSLGRAILSAMQPNELETALAVAALEPGSASAWDQAGVQKLIDEVHKAGYASSVGELESNISAIALPIRFHNVVGAINIVFFRAVMTPQAAAARYLKPLRACVRRVEKALAG